MKISYSLKLVVTTTKMPGFSWYSSQHTVPLQYSHETLLSHNVESAQFPNTTAYTQASGLSPYKFTFVTGRCHKAVPFRVLNIGPAFFVQLRDPQLKQTLDSRVRRSAIPPGLQGKSKAKYTLEQAMEAQRGS
jgi:hypothetical protein